MNTDLLCLRFQRALSAKGATPDARSSELCRVYCFAITDVER